MLNKIRLAFLAAIVLSVPVFSMRAQSRPGKDFNEALTLYENNMFSEAGVLFEKIARDTRDARAEGYALLCAISLNERDYKAMMDSYLSRFPYSGLVPMIHFRHALNLFDLQEYAAAADAFVAAGEKNIGKKDLPEYFYKLSYSRLQIRDNDGAKYGFRKVDAMRLNNYSGPSRFALGFMDYHDEKFEKALIWFGKSEKDKRFEDISRYYIVECRFMMKDYEYVTKHGEDIFKTVPPDRKPHLARIISESYLVQGQVDKAKTYYDVAVSGKVIGREDYFYAGSLFYAMKDYAGAIKNYSAMEDRSDSLGQIANYQMAFSYIQTKNKVAALDAFKNACRFSFNEEIREDAFFNYAKLSFDLNNDSSVFENYISEYSDKKRGDRIYAYQALAALHSKDYAGAVEAYDKIDELDDDMRSNYVKANYLRAEQLVRNGSFRGALPFLRAASYYSADRSPVNLLSKYWLAEAYYKDENYERSLSVFKELYNISALEGKKEGSLIPFNIAYCYFKQNDFASADSWFDKYIAQGGSASNIKDALLRKADASFMRADYKKAIVSYNEVLETYGAADDAYPIYQAGLAYGLSGDLAKKIEVLSGVSKVSPEAPLYSDALYELGRTYLEKGSDDEAITCFENILSAGKDSSLFARSLLGLGLAHMNKREYDKALGYYKRVVEQMPSTKYSADAMSAIDAVYQEKQEPEAYLAYVESIGKMPSENKESVEEMLFNGAEKVFLAGNYPKAIVSLNSYEERYPQGQHLVKAYFYLAESHKNTDNKEKACDYYEKVMHEPSSSFAEISALNYSKLSYGLEKFREAFEGYSHLGKIARIEGNKNAASAGLMRSAFKLKDYKSAVGAAEKVLKGKGSEAEKREASYIMAKSHLASSEREKAFSILKELSKTVKTSEGAEAAYLLIQESYDKGDFTDVEKKVFAFSESGSGQTYWLAKAFILLGDSYVEQDEFKQARATFESIRDGYTPSGEQDDVLDNVNMRLEKLAEMGK